MVEKYLTQFKRASIYGYFVFKLLVLLLIVALFDRLIGNTLNYLYFKINHEENFRTTYVLEQTRADILVFGSSRANHHYNAPMICQRLKQTCYNAGRDGNFIYFHYALLKGVLKRYSPKIVILDLIYEDIFEEPNSYDRISALLPYDRTHPEIREITRMKSKFEKYKLISRIYPFNSYFIRIITGNVDLHNKKTRELKTMGYKPINKTWNEPIQTLNKNSKIDSNKIEVLNSFILECQKAKVRLFVFVSPYYMKDTSNRRLIRVITDVTRKHNVPFWEYSQDYKFLSDPGNFGDMYHLNTKGADMYTEQVIDKIIHAHYYAKAFKGESIRIETVDY